MAIKTTVKRTNAEALIDALRMELPEDSWHKDPEIRRLMGGGPAPKEEAETEEPGVGLELESLEELREEEYEDGEEEY